MYLFICFYINILVYISTYLQPVTHDSIYAEMQKTGMAFMQGKEEKRITARG